MTADPLLDADYRIAVVDLLGVLAYGELSAFVRLAGDAALAPTLDDEAAIAGMAAVEYGHFVALRDRLTQLGVNPADAMAPFVAPLDEFHALTAPADWLEGVVKAYVGDGIAADFYREIAHTLDDETRALVIAVSDTTGNAEFAVSTVREAIVADPKVAGRLALWGRRLVGEAVSQAQRVAAERDGLTMLLVGGAGRPGVDLMEIGRMFTRLTDAHAQRMAALGLAS